MTSAISENQNVISQVDCGRRKATIKVGNGSSKIGRASCRERV